MPVTFEAWTRATSFVVGRGAAADIVRVDDAGGVAGHTADFDPSGLPAMRLAV